MDSNIIWVSHSWWKRGKYWSSLCNRLSGKEHIGRKEKTLAACCGRNRKEAGEQNEIGRIARSVGQGYRPT